MRTSRVPVGPAWRGFVVASLVAIVTACSFDQAPDDATPTTTPTPLPWSGELRYLPLGSDLCDQIRWSDISSELEISLDDIEPSATDSRSVRHVRCQIHRITGEHLGDRRASLNVVDFNLRVFEAPEDAYNFYTDTIDASAVENMRLTEQDDGWWTEGYSREYVQGGSSGFDSDVVYSVFDENLVVSMLLSLHDIDGVHDNDALGKVYEVARAVVDEVEVHLRCESLVDPPVPGCD